MNPQNATLSRANSHAIRFEVAFVDGPGTAGVGNDVVKIFVDGALKHTGTTWENYYRYDAEQAGNGNAIPTTSKLLFAARGEPVLSLLQNQGYLIDDVALSSSTTAPIVTPPTAEGVVYDGNKKCADLAPAGADFSDTGLHALEATRNYHDISHVSFCYTVGGDTQPTLDEPVTPQPGNPNPGNPNPGNPNAVNPNTAVQPNTEVLGVTLTQDATLPRTGTPMTQPLALAGGLGLALGLAMLLLASRRTAVVNH